MSAPENARNPLGWPEWSPTPGNSLQRRYSPHSGPTDADRRWVADTDAELRRLLVSGDPIAAARAVALQDLLDAWQRQVRHAPAPELLDVDTALAAIPRPVPPPRVSRIRVVVAAVVLVVAVVVAVVVLYGGIW